MEETTLLFWKYDGFAIGFFKVGGLGLGVGFLRLFLAMLLFRTFVVVLSVKVYFTNCFFFYSDSFVEFLVSFLFLLLFIAFLASVVVWLVFT